MEQRFELISSGSSACLGDPTCREDGQSCHLCALAGAEAAWHRAHGTSQGGRRLKYLKRGWGTGVGMGGTEGNNGTIDERRVLCQPHGQQSPRSG